MDDRSSDRQTDRQTDLPRFEPINANGRKKIPRKPVPRRSNSRRAESLRPETSRSFSRNFSWIGAHLPSRAPSIRPQPRHREQSITALQQSLRSWRFTSDFDPAMKSGLTVWDPELDRDEDSKRASAASTVVEALDVDWQLPPLKSYEPDYVRRDTIIDIAIDAQANHVPSPSDGPPPNGGLLAWMQVLGAFLVYFSSWGTMSTFGAFQTYYASGQGPWIADASAIAWIGSVQSFMSLIVGVVTGPLYDAGYFRALLVTGGFLAPMGFILTSFCTEYWQAFLAQGVIIGLGNGCLFVPSMAILPQYFTTRNALASGMAASGSSVGGIVMPFMLTLLAPRITFQWAVRVIGMLILAFTATALAILRPRVQPRNRRKLNDFSAFRELPFALYMPAALFGYMGYFIPLYYIGDFALDTQVTSPDFAFYLLPIINAASTFGRILPNLLADRIGPLNVNIPVAATCAILSFAWIAINSFQSVVAFSAMYGFFAGSLVAIFPVSLAALTPDLRVLGARIGIMFFFASFGFLLGPPLTGAIMNATNSWVGVQVTAGAALALNCVLLIAARTAKVGWIFNKRI